MIPRSWRVALLLSSLCLVLAVVSPLQGSSVGTSIGLLIAAVLFLLAMSPLPFPRPVSAVEAALRSAEDGMPVIYWRPGCQFCLRLRGYLGRDARRAHWVDIWHDPNGAAAVREITGGDETVPTVVIDGVGHVNPAPSLVRAAVHRVSPPSR